jgi:hypothetical protein
MIRLRFRDQQRDNLVPVLQRLAENHNRRTRRPGSRRHSGLMRNSLGQRYQVLRPEPDIARAVGFMLF